MAHDPRVLLVSPRNVYDPNARAHYSMTRALQHAGLYVRHFNPQVNAASRWGIQGRLRNRFFGRTASRRTWASPKEKAAVFAQRTRNYLDAHAGFDVVVAPNGVFATACLDASVPVIYTSDTTRKLMDGYYPSATETDSDMSRQLEELEYRALQRADRHVFYSYWAADSATQDYGVPPERIHVIPSGPSLDRIPDRDRATRRTVQRICRLLLVGGDWTRKGCDIAVQTCQRLQERGVPATLTICGAAPPAPIDKDGITCLPMLNKRKFLQRRKLHGLYEDSHCFLFPTRAECFGLAICEACAFGLPVITAHTGGVPEAVRDGVNGMVLPYDATPDDYARTIAEIWGNPQRYQEMVSASRNEYETRLNWDIWGKRVRQIIEKLIEERR